MPRRVCLFASLLAALAAYLPAWAFPPATEILEMARKICEIDQKSRFASTEKTISLAD